MVIFNDIPQIGRSGAGGYLEQYQSNMRSSVDEVRILKI
jgi:hypothetical protein